MKEKLQKRFKKVYPKNYRLLAIQLNGFSHKVFFDLGKKTDPVQCQEFSHCMPEGNWAQTSKDLFMDIGHNAYQNNAKEFCYILPKER